ncbi:MAG: UvrD-helicase domain-containing protein [Bacteroidales bacterium]|nr:UvrD-helicase domain-containing protein [Bacteroidales bacterium]
MVKPRTKLSSLTEEQESAVKATEGHIRVVAGAGSGKTRTLVYRYAYLLNDMGIPQSDILCMTFTNKAAQEMKTRISALCPGGVVGDFVTTIHGFCVKFLRKEIYRLGLPENYLIYDEEDMKALVKEVMEECGIPRKKGIVGNYMEELGKFKAATPYIEKFVLRTASFNPSDVPIFGKMILRQRRYFALDFDDLLYYTLYILENFPEVKAQWQQQFQYIMVDEVQDCDKSEWKLFTILSEQFGNLFVVGDADQAIYEWRGAHPELFVNWTPDTDVYLKNNFRSLPNIVCLSDCIIGNNQNRLPRTSITMRPASGFRTKLFHCKHEMAEAEKTASVLKNLNRKEHLAWKDMAILYRATYLSRAIEQTFIREKIPYVIWGGVRFFERREIKDALSYLRLAALDDDLSFKRIANVPSRKIGKKTMALLQGYAAGKGCSLFTALAESGLASKNAAAGRFVETILEARRFLDKKSISALLELLLDSSGLLEMYRVDTEEERLENLQELLKSIRLYEEENKNEEDLSVNKYLQDIALYTNADYRKDDDKVRLMTVHQAKGLEFPLVWIYGLNEGVLPSHRTIRERGEAGLEEERRLMYVACTRAMDRLYFSESEGYNVQNSQAKYPSRFIREAEDCQGPLYDIEGPFRQELWNGTDGLIRALEEPQRKRVSLFEEGDKVHHIVFGDGEIVKENEDEGTVSVRFKGFGLRRLNPESLTIVGED